ncbi:hypothetical protein EYF80_048480 [Liparis tanakae]|uniref:Uncharacterized protein n=1 Tax=Liparis tanakae TaxID=230148 RepID=A0A4Z2FKE1_9TELE|nr:hypothetical protein EYF80_048480 [Liparis tanakae]
MRGRKQRVTETEPGTPPSPSCSCTVGPVPAEVVTRRSPYTTMGRPRGELKTRTRVASPHESNAPHRLPT